MARIYCESLRVTHDSLLNEPGRFLVELHTNAYSARPKKSGSLRSERYLRTVGFVQFFA